jgi:4-amino-4-deoxy-L-arabinose transferase-like glycosyltransferase
MGVLIGMVQQVLMYARGRLLVSRRQLVLRLVNGVLLLICIALMFIGAVYRFTDLRVALLYWAVLAFLPVVVMLLAWWDLRELRRMRHRQQAELYGKLADLEQELRERQQGKS